MPKMMKQYLQTLLSIFLLNIFFLGLSSTNAFSLDSQELPDIKPGIATIQLHEPTRTVGYTVGDVLTREVTITLKKPYALIKESLPIVGYEKRYKGQTIGIDLSAISHNIIEDNNQTTHHLVLSYQVWTNNVVAKPAALPAEYLHIINTANTGKDKELAKLRIPSWTFAISPIATFGQVKVEADMTGFRGPLLLQNQSLKQRLNGLLAVLGLSLLGLLYILGKNAWLPRMGGPFARTYKQISKLPNEATSLQQAVETMHSALNKTAGNSVFSNNIETLIQKNEQFKTVKSELEQFFKLSRGVFFDANSQTQQDSLAWLQQFARQCRDCERGLIPETQAKG